MTARRWFVPGLVLFVAALLVAAGVVLLVSADRGDGDANRALVDTAATTQVVGQVSQALDQVLSYDYKDPDASSKAASQLLVGDASTQYTTLLDALRSKAGDQQLTLVAKTVVAGVSNLTSDHADLLVFLDQKSTRASDNATSTSAAQVQVSAVKQGDQWKVSTLLAL